MEDDFRLQDSKLAIIGLGLMGGSLALALKGKCAALYGIDSDPATLALALANGIVQQADTDPVKLLAQADLVILAVPVPAIMEFIQKLPSFSEKASIVFDLGSTKQDILQAMSALPENFDPIGGHPICGKEKLGLVNAVATLYQDAPFVVSSLDRTTRRAKSAVKEIVSAIGADCIEMTAEDHDRILAATSHLPFLVASALAHSTQCQKCSEESRGCTRVTDEEFCFFSRDPSSHACDRHFPAALIQLNRKAKSLQGFSKVTRVVGKEGIGKACGPMCQRGDQQSAVRQRLGTGNANRGIEGMIDWKDLQGR